MKEDFLRLKDLLDTLELTDRIIHNLDSFFYSSINYMEVKQKLFPLQCKSRNFLIENLK